MSNTFSDDEILALNLAFEDAHPREIVEWALATSGIERIAIASAFQADGSCVMHMASQIRPDVPILFLETGYQFAETLAFKERLTEQLGLNVVDLYGEYTVESQAEAFGPRLYERDPDACCDLNKVRPMMEALRELDAWVTAYRRDSSPTRADAPFVDRYEVAPGPLDREDQPDGRLDPRAGVGLPQGARPAAQPPLRPGLRLDRLRAVHATAVRRRARAGRALGGPVEVGVRDPAERAGRPGMTPPTATGAIYS